MRNAFIWGASGGIGQALTEQLIDQGWQVYAAARHVDNIPAGVAERYAFTAVDQTTIRDIALDLAHRTDGLDLWIYAAGGLQAEKLQQMTPETWTAVLDSNLNGAFRTIMQTVHLIKPGGHAFFIGAYIDHLILPKMGAYAVAKSGLETLVDVLQKENKNVAFTLVKPGAVDTPFWENAPFKMPNNAKSPAAVAQEIVAWQQAGKQGVLAL